MKKLIDNKFLFVVAISLITLIGLGIGAYYLFDDSDSTFVKSGYVLNPLSSKVEKYYFNENTQYKVNLSSMVEFSDVDKKDVTVLQDSFLHYMDNSISFLKKGAILDLNSITNDKKAVSFYNITDKSIINKTSDGYVISSTAGDINLKNFIGRISDSKYIIVGDVRAKITGNSKEISGQYFEIVYTANGVVNVENKDVKYQVAAEGSYIYIGDKVIDLGNKKIKIGDEDIMSLTAITINGDENIEIIPKAEDNKNGGNGQGNGDSQGNGQGTDGNGNGQGNNGNGTDNTGGNGTNGTGDNNKGNGDSNGQGSENKTKDIIVSLKSAEVSSTSIKVTFDIDNDQVDDKFVLSVVNVDTGRTVDIEAQVLTDKEIIVPLLSPSTKYLFTVTNERDGGKYFQKNFDTSSFGIKLEKSYATDTELGYKIVIDKGTDITNAKLSLYKYNEETHKNEIVKTSYYDAASDTTKYVEKVTYLSSLEGNIEGTHEVIYDGLDSNTIYTAVLDEFSVASANFKDVYNVTLTSMTLKKTPSFSEMVADKDVGKGSFKLSIDNIIDPDNAITNYTYLIYDNNDPSKTVIDPISKSNASPIEILVGEKDNQLKNDTNYFYKVVIEYYDNEKYIEYVTQDSINFVMGSDPYVTVVPNEKLISFDKIGATIYLKDNSCLISMPGREKCMGASSTVIDVSKINAVTGEKTSVYTKVVDFTVTEEEIKYDLVLDNLQANTTYSIEVRAKRNDKESEERVVIEHTDDSKRTITTKSLSNFIAEWKDKGSTSQHVVNLQSKLIAEEGTGTLSPEDSAASIKRVVVKLYKGEHVEDLQNEISIAEASFTNDDFNLKEAFYDNGYIITTDGTFGLDIDALKQKSEDGKLSEYYTVSIQAYYDNDGNNAVRISNDVTAYKINPVLLMENIEDPVIELKPITKNADNVWDKLVNPGTYVGYMITAAFDREGLLANSLTPKNINIYVYNSNKEKVKFYVKDDNGKLTLVDKITSSLNNSNYYEDKIYMGYGSEYFNNDSIMSRGNTYYIGFDIEVSSEDGNSWLYPTNSTNNKEFSSGVFEKVDTEKETPTLRMYIAKSTSDSVTYRYKIKDPDNAIYRESADDEYGFYYSIGDGEENKLALKNSDDNNYKYAGDMTITGLNNNDIYYLYYKKNVSKTGDFNNDVVKYIDGEDDGGRLFDGFYDAKDNNYNFNFEIINNQSAGNKVEVKILASDEMLDRIVNYKVLFKTDSKIVDGKKVQGGSTLEKNIWKLSTCSNQVEGERDRCFYVDYVELKKASMKSEGEIEIPITVTIEAFYDNGLTGFDYSVGDDKDYKYMILQNNNTSAGRGKYISYSNGGQITAWSLAIDAPIGYYNYTLKGTILTYISKLKSSNKSGISVNLSSLGYSSSVGTLNPKMISIDKMGSENNKFSFSSITPKVQVKEKSQLINGSVVDLTLSGVDLADFKSEDKDGDKEYYLYVETWNSMETANAEADLSNDKQYGVVRPTLKVKIDKNNPTNTLSAVIDGLADSMNYYYAIYAYLYVNGNLEYTRLFDAGYTSEYKSKLYNFKALSKGDLFHSIEMGYSANKEREYGSRDLNTKINLIAYKNNYPYNFDLTYVFRKYDGLPYDINDTTTKRDILFKRTVENKNIESSTISDTQDITDYDLEFGQRGAYEVYVYATVDYYQKIGSGFEVVKRSVELNYLDRPVTLKSLSEPSFVVSRNAKQEDGKYLIDFNINTIDKDRVLDNGVYYVNLVNSKGEVVGTLQEKDSDGNWVTVSNYKEHKFDASVVNKNIRITDLDSDEKYTILVFNNAYINNYDVKNVVKTYNETIENDYIDIQGNYTNTKNKFYIEVTSNGVRKGTLVKKVGEEYKDVEYVSGDDIRNGLVRVKDLTAGEVVVTIYDREPLIKDSHTVYSVNSYGVAFGRDILYSATEKSIVVTFLGGSSFDNVMEVNYTIGLWDQEQATYTTSGTYIIPDDKQFEIFKDTEDWRFIIDPDGMNNILGQTYTINLSFKVKAPDTELGYVILTSADNASFSGRTQYVKDEKSK